LDTLTHALSGALLARATAPREHGPGSVPTWQRVTVGALAAAFPDMDFIASYVGPLVYLVNHRGITHSIVLLPVWALLLAWLAARVSRQPRGWRAFFGVAAMGVGIHILGDLITGFGTMILAPFSTARFAWGTTFIIDLWFSGIILAGLLLSLLRKGSRLPAVAACVVLVCYVGFQGWLRHEAIEFGEQSARAEGVVGARVSAQAGPVSPFNWMVVVQKDGEYRYARVNLFRREVSQPAPDAGFFARLSAPYRPRSAVAWQKASLLGAQAADASLAREAWAQDSLGFFRWFAEYPALYRIDRGNPSVCVWFYDLRFERPGVTAVPFRYGVCRENAGPWQRYQLEGEAGRVRLD
jgi:inner membrane protein